MIGSMPSDTGNTYYATCKRCGERIEWCRCWWDFMDALERIIAIKAKLDKYKYVKIKSIYILVLNLIRKTPTSISGMKGVALLKRIDKR